MRPVRLLKLRQLVGLRGVVAFVAAVGVFADEPLTGNVDESPALRHAALELREPIPIVDDVQLRGLLEHLGFLQRGQFTLQLRLPFADLLADHMGTHAVVLCYLVDIPCLR